MLGDGQTSYLSLISLILIAERKLPLLSMYGNCGEIKNFSTTGKKLSFSTWQTWRNLKFSTSGMCLMKKCRHIWKICATFCKISFVMIYTVCREICLIAIYALLSGEILCQNFTLWRKNDKYEVWFFSLVAFQLVPEIFLLLLNEIVLTSFWLKSAPKTKFWGKMVKEPHHDAGVPRGGG